MEKQKAHYPLSRVKALIQTGAYRVTRTALRCAASDFGYIKASQIAQCMLGIQGMNFYKSMTAHHDSKHWQDVYHPSIGGMLA